MNWIIKKLKDSIEYLSVCYMMLVSDYCPLWLYSLVKSTVHVKSLSNGKLQKIIPIFKKGSKIEVENYRPIANLCSASKVFEKLILKQIHYLESKNKLDLTGKQQHGFKRKKSTAAAGTLLQSFIAYTDH